MLDAFERELNTSLDLLLVSDIIGLEDSLQDLIPAYYMLIRLHVFLGVFFLLRDLSGSEEGGKDWR